MIKYSSIVRQFPGLKPGEYKFVHGSERTNGNCIALSLNIPSPWIWPTAKGYVPSINSTMASEFWPRKLSNDYTLDNFLNMYQLFGFEQTDEAGYEEGYWKNAIYGHNESDITHAAHLLQDGTCVSKLGAGPLLIHQPKAIEGYTYGRIITYVKRKLPLDKENFLRIIIANS